MEKEQRRHPRSEMAAATDLLQLFQTPRDQEVEVEESRVKETKDNKRAS